MLELDKEGVIVIDSPESFTRLLSGQQHVAWQDFQRLFPHACVDEILTTLKKGDIFQTVVKIHDKNDLANPYRYFNMVFSHCQLDGERVEIGAIQDIAGQKTQDQNNILNNHIGNFFVTDRDQDKAIWNKNSEDIVRKDFKVKHRDREIYCLVSITALQEPNEIHAFVTIINDITPLKTSERQLTDMAFKDGLTGLGNRNYLTYKLRQAEINNVPDSLIFIDLDLFKLINDNYAHEAGDLLLVDVSKRFNNHMRISDTLFRFGGDEFVVMKMGNSKPECNKLAHRLLKIFKEPFLMHETKIYISASIGIAMTIQRIMEKTVYPVVIAI